MPVPGPPQPSWSGRVSRLTQPSKRLVQRQGHRRVRSLASRQEWSDRSFRAGRGGPLAGDVVQAPMRKRRPFPPNGLWGSRFPCRMSRTTARDTRVAHAQQVPGGGHEPHARSSAALPNSPVLRSRAARFAGRAPGVRRWGAGPGTPTLRSSPCTAISTRQAPYQPRASCGVPTRTRPVLVGRRPGRVKQRWSVPLDPTERPPLLAAYRVAPPPWR
jgi:hypothetical protein